MLGSSLNYSLVVWCSWRIWLSLRASFAHTNADGHSIAFGSTQRRALSRQINTVLVFQAVTPLILELVPMTILTLGSLFVSSEGDTSSLYTLSSTLTLFLNWAPVVNALSAVCVIGSYRRALVKAISTLVGRSFCRKRTEVATGMAGSHTPAANVVSPHVTPSLV